NGQISFSGTAGQQVSLQMSGVSISGSWVTIQQNPTLLPLTAGQQYSVDMRYFQGGSGSVARLKWSSPSTLKQVIPQTQLTPAEGAAGTGLKGDYYSNTTVSGTPTFTRTDPTVNFDWSGGSPGSSMSGTSMSGSNWSARWTGQIQAQYSEQYTVCTETDDGARLWVNGTLVLDHWVGQGTTEWCYNTPSNVVSQHQSGAGSISNVTLPAAGAYTIIVDADAAATGSMTLTLTSP